jgi:Fur family transcriptional regulator, ferric uptake regulator
MHPTVPPSDNLAKADGLRASGLKATLPRLKIMEIFQQHHHDAGAKSRRHMSAEDVYKLLIKEDSDIGLATVYRVLQQFADAGLLKRHHFDEGKAVFELDEGTHHDHLVCLDCGRVEEFFDAEIEQRQKLVAEQRGFKLQEHSLALYASCTKVNCPNK